MPIVCTFDPERGLINTVASGEVGLRDVAAHLREVSAQPWFPAPALADLREVSGSTPSDEVRAIVGLLRQLAPQLSSAPIAVLVASDLSYGLVRMLELLLDDVIAIRPFRDPEAAIRWLSEQRAH